MNRDRLVPDAPTDVTPRTSAHSTSARDPLTPGRNIATVDRRSPAPSPLGLGSSSNGRTMDGHRSGSNISMPRRGDQGRGYDPRDLGRPYAEGDDTPVRPTFGNIGRSEDEGVRPSIESGTLPYSLTDRSLAPLTAPQPVALGADNGMLRSASEASASSRTALQDGDPARYGGSPQPQPQPGAPIAERDYAHGGAASGYDAASRRGPMAEEQRYTTVPLHAGQEANEKKYGTADERGRKRTSQFFGNVFGGKHAAGDPEKQGRPANPRASSWDLLKHRRDDSADPNATGTSTPRRGGARTPEWEGFEFNTANASIEQLKFADGDVGRSKIAKGYYYLLSKSIITRWFLYIVPILILLWVPGIVWLAGVHSARVWGVPLLYWSIWLSVLWVGWWAALAAAMLLPKIVRVTLGTIVPGMKTYVDVAENLVRSVAFIVWAAAIWISFTPILINQYIGDQGAKSRVNLTTIVQLLFGLFLSSLVVGAEKLIIQMIAYKFHQDSYADRIVMQKAQIRSLVTLYINSHEIRGRNDTLKDNATVGKGPNIHKIAVRRALKGLRNAAQTTTTAIGNVATEMTGQSVLQTNSPYNRVTTALMSANKSKQLARRLYYSFRQPELDHLRLEDIARYFPNLESAVAAFMVFDRDDNGDATRDEIEMACLQIHREKMSLEASMKDLDGAVRKLDSIFMVLVLAIVILIMSAMITNRLTTLVTSAGAFVLGLSWLIGTTMQEILGACIFLFVKHPFDVGDRVDIDGNSFVVSSMQLLSTTFKRTDGTYTFVGNFVLKDKYIYNIRRSGPIAETFLFEVDFETPFEKLQELREKMLAFLKENGRDYLQVFDVIVDDLPAQGKMNLKADIKYKTNWQEGALKVQRRNRWICALKTALADSCIYGPAGAGNPSPPPADPIAYTMVPYVAPPAPTAEASSGATRVVESPPPDFAAATQGGMSGAALLDQRQVIEDSTGEIFDDEDNYTETAPPSGATTPHPAVSPASAFAARHRNVQPGAGFENIEMTPARRR